MPADINEYLGRVAGWHNLGEAVGHHLSWVEACRRSKKVNYEVEKRQLEWNGKPIEQWGTFRTDNDAYLAPVGKDYVIHPHQLGLKIVDGIVQSRDGAHYETLGVLGVGETVWGLADLSLALRVGNDVIKRYLLFTTSYDAMMSTTFKTVDERVVCRNTLVRALGEKTSQCFNIRHVKGSLQRLVDAEKALANLEDDALTFEERLNFLASRVVTQETATQIFARLFPVSEEQKAKPDYDPDKASKTLQGIIEAYEFADNKMFLEQYGTAYHLLNAITDYVDHNGNRIKDASRRANSGLFGSGNKLKTRALEVITEMANGMPSMPGRGSRTTLVTVPEMAPLAHISNGGGSSLLEGVLDANGY